MSEYTVVGPEGNVMARSMPAEKAAEMAIRLSGSDDLPGYIKWAIEAHSRRTVHGPKGDVKVLSRYFARQAGY